MEHNPSCNHGILVLLEGTSFLAHQYKYTGRAVALPLASAVAAAFSKCLNFYVRFFNVMGKMLTCLGTGLVCLLTQILGCNLFK